MISNFNTIRESGAAHRDPLSPASARLQDFDFTSRCRGKKRQCSRRIWDPLRPARTESSAGGVLKGMATKTASNRKITSRAPLRRKAPIALFATVLETRDRVVPGPMPISSAFDQERVTSRSTSRSQNVRTFNHVLDIEFSRMTVRNRRWCPAVRGATCVRDVARVCGFGSDGTLRLERFARPGRPISSLPLRDMNKLRHSPILRFSDSADPQDA